MSERAKTLPTATETRDAMNVILSNDLATKWFGELMVQSRALFWEAEKVEPAKVTCPNCNEPSEDVAWFIEHPSDPRYGRESWYSGKDGFTIDSLLAVRFARKEDAVREIDRFPVKLAQVLIATEHMWLDDTHKPPTQMKPQLGFDCPNCGEEVARKYDHVTDSNRERWGCAKPAQPAPAKEEGGCAWCKSHGFDPNTCTAVASKPEPAPPASEEIATLRARVAELEAMVPRWVPVAQKIVLDIQGWLPLDDQKCGDDERLWLMVPPIPLPEPKGDAE